jgi:hypothetical protein
MVLSRRLALLLVALGAGCGPGPENNGPDGPGKTGSGATIKFVLKSGTDVASLPARAGDLTVESAAFWIDKMYLSGDRGGDHSGQDRVEAGLLDLTGGPVSFDLPDAAPALYSRLRVEFAESGDHGRVPAFEGMPLSFRVSGKTAGGLPFALTGQDDFRLELRMVDGAELGARTRLECVVRLDMNGWFNGVALPVAPDPDHQEEAVMRFVDNLVGSASLSLNAVSRD